MAQWIQTIRDDQIERLKACYLASYGPKINGETDAQYANRCTFYAMRDAVLSYERAAAQRAVAEPTPIAPS